jgi:HD-GYP domain-containing protein (c-di-GMP phosphodiesterase class II)
MHGLDELKLFGRMVMVVGDGIGERHWLSHIGLDGEDLALMGSSPPVPPDRIKGLLAREHRICNSYYVPFAEQRAGRLLCLKHPAGPAGGDEWRPGEILAVPLVAKDAILGYLAALDPADGRVPTLETVRLLELYANQAATAIVNLGLYDDLEVSYYDTLKAFVAAMEAKDPYTKGHSENVRSYALRLSRHLGLSGDRLRVIDYSSLLHDIGKMGINESILNKPDTLSEEEYREVKQHPSLGGQMVSGIGILAASAPIIQAHHEHFDGSGYPDGRRGPDIPLEARIIAVADAYEAMTSDRPYRRAYSPMEARGRLREAAGRQFDADLVESFVGMLEADG